MTLTTLLLSAALAIAAPCHASPLPKAVTPEATSPRAALPAQFDAVTTAIARGDAAAVSAYLDKTVELALPGLDDIYTREQAAAKLKGFFGLHPPSGFSRVHGGTSRGEVGAYVIGSLKSGSKSFRVYLYGVGEAQPIIQEIRIEEE